MMLLRTLPLAFLLTIVTLHAEVRSGRAEVLPGIDVLKERHFDVLAGKRVGLITNHTGRTRGGISDIDVLFSEKSFSLVALFSPEHGIRGTADETVDNGKDEKTGLPIYSLYGKTLKPTPEMLQGLDILVFDIQDIGTRFYTYIGTMALAMRAAKENGKKFVVLDRPNPIGGEKVEGAIPTTDFCSGITCIFPIATRHGMTIGELARMFNDHFGIGCELEVVPMQRWTRNLLFDQTGLPWANPSPNMKTLNGAIFYPGLGVAETTSLSVGRGTSRPFEVYGAPYINSAKLLDNLSKRNIPGIRFEAISFIPTALYHPYKDQLCHGVAASITDRDQLDSVLAGLNLIQAFYETHPRQFTPTSGFKVEVGDRDIWNLLTSRKLTPEQIVLRWQNNLDNFKRIRAKYLLY
ncbi:MAG TPA: DUF1343 domain-containing protein [Bdellovibrionota bacterium]|nr:DUF1343 domain-containing protein [Bdellovibrionota bacterium]